MMLFDVPILYNQSLMVDDLPGELDFGMSVCHSEDKNNCNTLMKILENKVGH